MCKKHVGDQDTYFCEKKVTHVLQSETVGDVFVFYFHGVTLLFFIFF